MGKEYGISQTEAVQYAALTNWAFSMFSAHKLSLFHVQRSKIAEVPSYAALTDRALFLESVHKLQTRREGEYIYSTVCSGFQIELTNREHN
jgi:hypothetical protein